MSGQVSSDGEVVGRAAAAAASSSLVTCAARPFSSFFSFLYGRYSVQGRPLPWVVQ
jgi:hypothetical protein